MLLINWTKGFSQTYWWPVFKRQRDKEIWYIEVCFLRVQVTLYSRAMGQRMLEALMMAERKSDSGGDK